MERRFVCAMAAAALLAACAHNSTDSAGDGARRAGFASSEGVRIAYDTQGSGPLTLVLVHGWSCDRTYWRDQIAALSQDYRVVTVDLAGHGESAKGQPKDWTIASFGDDVAAVVQKLNLEQVILIGHSMGGDVIVDTARLLPERVVGLVWVDTYSKLGTARSPEQVQGIVAPFRTKFTETTQALVRGSLFRPGADPQLVDRVATDMSSAPPEVSLTSMESSFSNDGRVPPLLQALKLPVIAINPEDDPALDRDSMQRYGVNVVQMPGVGHFMMMEDPARFNRLLRAAVKTLSSR